MIVSIENTVITFDYAHAQSLIENLRFSNFPKREPRGRAHGELRD